MKTRFISRPSFSLLSLCGLLIDLSFLHILFTGHRESFSESEGLGRSRRGSQGAVGITLVGCSCLGRPWISDGWTCTWECVCLLIEWVSWSVIEMRLKQTGGLLVDQTLPVQQDLTTTQCTCCEVSGCFYHLSCLTFTLCSSCLFEMFQSLGASSFLVTPLKLHPPSCHPFSPVLTLPEGPDSRRAATPPPERNQDEQRGRATRSEVNDQWGAERRDMDREWAGSLQEQSETRRRLNDAHVAV